MSIKMLLIPAFIIVAFSYLNGCGYGTNGKKKAAELKPPQFPQTVQFEGRL